MVRQRQNENPLDGMLTAQEVAIMLRVSVRTVWRMLQREEMPQPIRYNRKLVRWRRTEVERFVEARLAARDLRIPT
jgi:excisionase family DNA binding protein